MALFSTKKAPAAEYFPSWGGNREAPVEDQWGIELEPMTAAELQAQREIFNRKTRGSSQMNAARAGFEFRNAVVSARAKKLVGRPVEVETETEQVQVLTGKQLVELAKGANEGAPDDLLDEIFKAITDQSALAEGVRKNS